MMRPDPEVASVAAALARAHRASTHGSDAARRGAIGEREAYVQALLAAAQDATRSWANWEAINDRLVPGGDVARSLEWLSLNAVGDIRKALARDAILGAYRLSDYPSGDRLTLCRVATWLDDGTTTSQILTREWATNLGYPELLLDDAIAENERRVQRLKSLLVGDWCAQRPRDKDFLSLRSTLRSTRDHLAHAIDSEIGDPPTVEHIRRFIGMTLELATDAALLWHGAASAPDEFREDCRSRASKFWQFAFAGPIGAWTEDMNRRLSESTATAATDY